MKEYAEIKSARHVIGRACARTCVSPQNFLLSKKGTRFNLLAPSPGVRPATRCTPTAPSPPPHGPPPPAASPPSAPAPSPAPPPDQAAALRLFATATLPNPAARGAGQSSSPPHPHGVAGPPPLPPLPSLSNPGEWGGAQIPTTFTLFAEWPWAAQAELIVYTPKKTFTFFPLPKHLNFFCGS